eukprot:EG_transcript_34551
MGCQSSKVVSGDDLHHTMKGRTASCWEPALESDGYNRAPPCLLNGPPRSGHTGCPSSRVVSLEDCLCAMKTNTPSCWEPALENDGHNTSLPCLLNGAPRSTTLLFGDSLHRPLPVLQALSALPWAMSEGDDTFCTSAESTADDDSSDANSSDHSLRVLPPDSPNWLLPAEAQRQSPTQHC